MSAAHNAWQMVKDIFQEFGNDKVLELAAALSFYALLSLAPLLMLFIGVAGLLFGQKAASGQIVSEIQTMVGHQGAEVAQTILQHAATPGGNIVAIVVSVVTLLVGATGVFSQLQSSLNQIWDVQARPGQGATGFLRTRLLSLAMVAGIGLLLLVFMILSAVLATITTYMSQILPGVGVLWSTLNFVVPLIVVTLLFAMIFKGLPDVEISWSDVWVGAIVTGVLFTIGKTLIGLYLGHSSVSSVYGAAGSVVALVVWVYYSSLILFIGAEFTQVYARRYGKRIEPSKWAFRTDVPQGGQGLAGAH